MNEILASLLLLVSLLINLSSLDDIFIDLLSFGIAHFPFRRAAAKPATLPNIAIFVANWREEDVIGKMVEGNLARIDIPQVSLFLGAGLIDPETVPREMYRLLQWSLSFNLLATVFRYVARLSATYRVYGRLDWLGIAIRWPVSLYINMVATFRAWKIYLGESQFATSPIVWSKTAHDVPDDFLGATR